MVTTQSTLDALNRLYAECKVKCDKLRDQLIEAEKGLEALEITIKMLGFAPPNRAAGIELSGMTQLEALIAIAKANGGTLIVKAARKLMVTAGLFKNPDNASSIIFTTIARSKRFEKAGKGKYKLRPEQQKLEPFPLPSAVAAG